MSVGASRSIVNNVINEVALCRDTYRSWLSAGYVILSAIPKLSKKYLRSTSKKIAYDKVIIS